MPLKHIVPIPSAALLRAIEELLRAEGASLSRYSKPGHWTIVVARSGIASDDLTKLYDIMKNTNVTKVPHG